MTAKVSTIGTISALLFLLPIWACTRGVAREPDRRSAAAPPAANGRAAIEFTDLRTQTAEFIQYYKTIRLTPEQEKTKTEALSSIPAPCCGKFSAATCCCPCNFSKSLWGLSHYLIAKEGRSVEDVRSAALRWIAFTHPNGSSGQACFNGGCNRSFSNDGCGGMQDSDLKL